jgi:hypothetical protein
MAAADRQQTAKRRFNPRVLPPLIGLGLLLLIGIAVLVSRRGPSDDRVQGLVVRQVEQTPQFTYLEVDDKDGSPLWLAARRVEVAVGDKVHFESAEPASHFEAPSLKRTFDRILLVAKLYKVDADGRAVALESQAAIVGGAADDAHGGTPEHGGHPPHGLAAHGSAGRSDIDAPKLEKPAGGQSLAELVAEPNKFSGQSIKVRGTVVSARLNVRPAFGAPPTNWYRLHDGSDKDILGKDGSDNVEPLLFTTDELLQRGDVVAIAGKLSLDKDFGGGLSYKMIVEDAKVTREKPAAAAEKAAGPVDTTQPREKQK